SRGRKRTASLLVSQQGGSEPRAERGHDLVGAAADRPEAGVAERALHVVLAHVAVAAVDQDCLVRHLDRGSAASSPFVQASWSAGSFFRLSNRPSTPLALGNREPARARCRSTWTWAQTPRTTRSPPTRAAARSPAPAPPRLETCS